MVVVVVWMVGMVVGQAPARLVLLVGDHAQAGLCETQPAAALQAGLCETQPATARGLFSI